MNILFIKHFFVGFMVSEIPRVSVFGHCPYSVTFPYRRDLNECKCYVIWMNVYLIFSVICFFDFCFVNCKRERSL